MNTITKKYGKLKNILKGYSRVAIAYSGGVDSTLLLKTAADTLGRNNVLAITAVSETYTKNELLTAKKCVRMIGIKHLLLKTNELRNTNFSSNPPDRCYHCKVELYKKILTTAKKLGYTIIAEGSNTDDLHDHRPGRKALTLYGIRSPLLDAGLSKPDIRVLSKQLKLPTWSHPSCACLASRLPYGTPITRAKLFRIESAEQHLRSLGYTTVRVRDYGDTARIEITADKFNKTVSRKVRTKITQYLHALGYLYVTLDLEEYKTGSMNKVLHK
ncbi:MAG: ATP-dependent sacrificial sulfur transferase LarE [Elusimicrobiota bacterium]